VAKRVLLTWIYTLLALLFPVATQEVTHALGRLNRHHLEQRMPRIIWSGDLHENFMTCWSGRLFFGWKLHYF
jgi:hypothetical protein